MFCHLLWDRENIRVKVNPCRFYRMSSDDEIPAYLKSLEEVLSRPTEEPVQKPVDTPVEQPVKDSSLSLSNIGFGSMFTSPETSSQKKLKFMLVSTHIHQMTGYSKVSYGILCELVKHPWLQLTHYAFQKQPEVPTGFRPYPAGIDVIDAMALEKPVQQGF